MPAAPRTRTTDNAASPREAPRWVWALLGVWILSTGVTASWLAPVDLPRGSLCRTPAPSAPAAGRKAS